MSSRFRRARDGAITVTFEAVEAAVLANLVGQLVAMLEERGPSAGGAAADDPLMAVLGPDFGSDAGDVDNPISPPADSVLARLLPDGYRDDPEAAAEFRRYTEHELRSRKLDAAAAFVASIGDGGKITLDDKQADSWLAVLNDLRLAIGTRLDVTEDYHEMVAALPEDDPRLPMYEIYEWLTWLQDSLVDALAESMDT